MAKKKKKGNVVLNIFIAAVFLTGAGIFLYPTFSDMWNQYRNAKLISKYEQSTSNLSEENYEKLWKEAEEYNQSLNSASKASAVSYEDLLSVTDTIG